MIIRRRAQPRAASPRSRRRARIVALAALGFTAALSPALTGQAVSAQPTDEWVSAEGLTITAEATECGSLGGAGDAVLTITADDPERTWGYAVRGTTLEISSPASDNSGSVEIPIGGAPGNYFAAAFHLPENGVTPIATTGFTIEPCQPGPPISITTTCAAEGGSASAVVSLSGLAPSSDYRQTFSDTSGAVIGDPATFTADASGIRVVQSAPLADDSAYRSELHWLPPPVAEPEWPTGDFVPVTTVPLSAADFTVGICASAQAPAPPPTTPSTTTPLARPTLAASGSPDATSWLLAAAASSALGLATLTVARLGRVRSFGRWDDRGRRERHASESGYHE